MAAPLVEKTLFTDIQDWIGKENGTYKVYYRNYESVLIKEDGGYRLDGQDIRTAKTAIGYGSRLWFVCPCCQRNSKRLYKPYLDVGWACRNCHHLVYKTSRISGTKYEYKFEYLTEQIKQIQSQFDMSYSYSYTSLTDAEIERIPLFKSKYMRREKFDALRFELEYLIVERLRVLCEMYE